MNRRRRWLGWLFILPWFIGFLWLDLGAFVANLAISFSDYTPGTHTLDWVGVEHYHKILTSDHLIPKSTINTVYFAAIRVPLLIAFAFALALLLNTQIRGLRLFRAVYYIPSLVPVVASVVMWRLILGSSHRGIINQLLAPLGVGPIPWFRDPTWSKPGLILMSLWGFGASTVIYLAGLQAIPEQLYEAALIDGANGWQRMIRITLPLMTPTIFFNLITGFISAFQVFTSAFLLTGGGPLNSTLFYMLYLYRKTFSQFNMGYGAAMAVLLFVVILLFTLFLQRTSKRWVFYLGE